MARLRRRKTKHKSYYLDFRYRGKRHVLSLKTSDRRIAEKAKAEIEAKIVRGIFGLGDDRRKDISLSQYFPIYFRGIEGTKKESTIAGERTYASTFLKIVGDVSLGSVDIEILEHWKSQRLKKVKAVSFNDERRALNHIFNKAIDYGYIQTNPFKKLKRMKEEQKKLYMTSEEIQRFYNALDAKIQNARNKLHRADHYKFKLYCEVLLNTGMRRSELLDLRVENIDFENNVVHLENTKGNKRREVPMTGRVSTILREFSPGLFSDMTKDQVTHKFTDCAKKIGLKGVKLHSLRHTFGTYLIAMGYDITVAKELLGHEDIRTTMIYAKANTRLLRDAIRSFEALGRNGYKMVTKNLSVGENFVDEKEATGTDEAAIS